jgi:hypothetical protein
MPFINKKEAFQILSDIKKGVCKDSCRSVWMRNIRYALKTNTNPLKLTDLERQKMTKKIAEITRR